MTTENQEKILHTAPAKKHRATIKQTNIHVKFKSPRLNGCVSCDRFETKKSVHSWARPFGNSMNSKKKLLKAIYGKVVEVRQR